MVSIRAVLGAKRWLAFGQGIAGKGTETRPWSCGWSAHFCDSLRRKCNVGESDWQKVGIVSAVLSYLISSGFHCGR